MKNINTYIIEKILINKDTIIDNNKSIKSTVDTTYPNEYMGVNFLFDSQNWPNGHFTFIMEYVKKVLDETNLNEKERKFVEDIYNEFKELKKKHWGSYQEKTDLINGEKPKFERAKFFYDMFNWVLKTQDLTIPRKQKINKIMRYIDNDHTYTNYNVKPNITIIKNIKGLSWAE